MGKGIWTLIVLLGLSVLGTHAQNGEIKGMVFDPESEQSIPFASVALMNGEEIAAGTVSDASGKFSLNNLKFGEYSLVVSFIGYQAKTIEKVVLSKEKRTKDLANISLATSNVKLNDVNVTAMAKSVTNKIDRRSYRATDFATARGGSATDVLNKLPSVSVDPDGAVSVRGTTDFMVYLNGKPTKMSASVLLGQIQSENIESVDVITVPTARYDAQGKGGIVNINTKRTAQEGFSIIANGMYGGAPWNNLTDKLSGFDQNDERYNGGLSFIYNKNNINLYGGGNFSRRNVNGLRTGDARLVQPDGSYYHMVASGERPEWYKNHSAFAGLDYQLSDKSSLSASYYYGNRKEGRSAFYVYNNFYGDKNKQAIAGVDPRNEHIYNPNTDNRYGKFHTSNIDFKTKFDNNSSLSLSLLYEYSDLSRKLDNRDYTFDKANEEVGDKRRHFKQSDDAPLNGYRFSADYEKELDNGHTISMGFQPEYITHDDNFSYNTQDVTSGNWNNYSSLENAIELTRGIYSTYFDYAGKWNELSFIAGLRLEYMDQEMDIANPDYFTIFDRATKSTYTTEQLDWFPSLHLSYNLNENADKINLAASRRINRPKTTNMAPFLYRRHYEVYLVGDPSLKPEYLNNLELSYETTIGKQNFSLAAFYRGTDDAVFRVNTVYTNGEIGAADWDHNKVLVRSYTNAGKTTALGSELNANMVLSSKVKMFVGASLYYYNVKGDVFGYKEDNSSTNWSVKGNLNWMVSKELKFTADFDVKSATVTAQGKNELLYMGNTAINYSPAKLKAWNFSLRVLDVLASNDTELSTRAFDSNSVEIFYQDTEYQRQGPIVELGVNYSFNMKGKSGKKGKSAFGKDQF